MTQRSEIQPGDVIEITLTVKAHTVEHMTALGMNFTAITFEHGAPYRDVMNRVHPPEWTLEIPDGYGRIVKLVPDV